MNETNEPKTGQRKELEKGVFFRVQIRLVDWWVGDGRKFRTSLCHFTFSSTFDTELSIQKKKPKPVQTRVCRIERRNHTCVCVWMCSCVACMEVFFKSMASTTAIDMVMDAKHSPQQGNGENRYFDQIQFQSSFNQSINQSNPIQSNPVQSPLVSYSIIQLNIAQTNLPN